MLRCPTCNSRCEMHETVAIPGALEDGPNGEMVFINTTQVICRICRTIVRQWRWDGTRIITPRRGS